jgi:hypothetical protein
MPEGTTSTAVMSGMRLLVDEVIARGWHLSPRLHVLLWEDARGRRSQPSRSQACRKRLIRCPAGW